MRLERKSLRVEHHQFQYYLFMMVIINFSEIFGVFQRIITKCHLVASKEEQGHALSLKSIHHTNFTKVDIQYQTQRFVLKQLGRNKFFLKIDVKKNLMKPDRCRLTDILEFSFNLQTSQLMIKSTRTRSRYSINGRVSRNLHTSPMMKKMSRI